MLDRREAAHLLEYHRWATAKLVRSLAPPAESIAEVERVLAHLAGAEELWWARVAGEDPRAIAVWPANVPHAEIVRRLDAVGARWREHFEECDETELARVVRFTNTRGEACADPVESIVRQLVIHGSHHRGQIAMLLRAAGRTPETLDYVVWRREKAKAPAVEPTPWKHFVIESTYTADIARIDEQLAAHRAHLEEGFKQGLLLASGPQSPRTGGYVLARARDKSELESFLARDPFQKAGYARYRVTEFAPVKHQPWLAEWVRGA